MKLKEKWWACGEMLFCMVLVILAISGVVYLASRSDKANFVQEQEGVFLEPTFRDFGWPKAWRGQVADRPFNLVNGIGIVFVNIPDLGVREMPVIVDPRGAQFGRNLLEGKYFRPGQEILFFVVSSFYGKPSAPSVHGAFGINTGFERGNSVANPAR